MARIDDHVVRLHGILDFVDNCLSCSLDPKNLGDLNDMVGGCMLAHNA